MAAHVGSRSGFILLIVSKKKLRKTLLIRKFVGDDLSLYYELKPLKTRDLACGSLETEEA